MAVAVGKAREDRLVELRADAAADGGEAVDLINRLTQDQAPTAVAALEEVVEAAGADHVAEHIVDVDPLGDCHLRLRHRAVTAHVDRAAAEEMEDADPTGEALLADLDELGVGTLPPGRHHPAVLMPDGAEALPVTGVAP